MKKKQTLKKMVLTAAAVAVMGTLSAAPALAQSGGVNQSNISVNQSAEVDGDGAFNDNVVQQSAQVQQANGQNNGGGVAIGGQTGDNESVQIAF